MAALADASCSSDTIQQDPFPSFPRFNDLPVEIRSMIWDAACLEPRLVSLQLRPLKIKYYEWKQNLRAQPVHEGSQSGPADSHPVPGSLGHSKEPIPHSVHRNVFPPSFNLLGPTSPSEIPSVLLACHESNGIASYHYTRTFSNGACQPETYFNFQQDILYINYNDILTGWTSFTRLPDYLDYIHFSDLRRVEKLAIFRCREEARIAEETIGELLGQFFPNLKSLFLVLADHKIYRTSRFDTSPLSLLDPIDIVELERSYGNYNPERWGFQEPNMVYLDQDWATIQMGRLLHRTLSWVSVDQGYILPKVENKIVVSSDYMKQVDSAKEYYREVINRHNKRAEPIAAKLYE